MPLKDKDLLITRHNSLIEGCYKLNLDEQRLLYLCITQLDPRKPLPKDNSFTVTGVLSDNRRYFRQVVKETL